MHVTRIGKGGSLQVAKNLRWFYECLIMRSHYLDVTSIVYLIAMHLVCGLCGQRTAMHTQ